MQRREYVASLVTTGVIQLFLACFLLVGALRSWIVMRSKFPNMSWYVEVIVPLGIVAIAAFIGRSFVISVLRAREAVRDARRSSKP
jgi:hypothetical protein